MSELKLGTYWSAPLAESTASTDEMSAACCSLARGLMAAQRQIDGFEKQPATIGDLLLSRIDGVALMSRADTGIVAAARAAHALLVAALGPFGTIHDVSEGGVAGTRPLRLSDADLQLQHLEEKLRDLRAALLPASVPVARGGRVAA